MSIDRSRFPSRIREDHAIQRGQIASKRHKEQRGGLDATAQTEEIHSPALLELCSDRYRDLLHSIWQRDRHPSEISFLYQRSEIICPLR